MRASLSKDDKLILTLSAGPHIVCLVCLLIMPKS